ncbi:hypothetical protein CSUB01_03563 [Colletotrichum sublineola]|uniref:Uncharacterized protein n=1 Tax=Colletotrichum sublineola TaxID=1173701 RepID=A0A066XFM5_COLSU|nr:hypothetical protein CSUB01_03563 [Colletotrichum sublineola]
MAITRIGLIALADEVKQDEAVARFSNFANDCKKEDGQTYIVASKASKCKVLTDVPGSQPWTVVYEITFANETSVLSQFPKEKKKKRTESSCGLECACIYPIFKELMTQAAEGKATGFIAVSATGF